MDERRHITWAREWKDGIEKQSQMWAHKHDTNHWPVLSFDLAEEESGLTGWEATTTYSSFHQ